MRASIVPVFPCYNAPMCALSLKTKWFQLASGFSNDAGLIDRLFGPLDKAYRASGRHYHSSRHLETLLTLAEQCRKYLIAPELVEFAIWYHDAIYNPLKKDNEHRSAEWARKDLTSLGLTADEVEQVANWIGRTQNHMQREANECHDLQWFLDFDLTILGEHRHVYAVYMQQVRREYWMIPEPLYRKGRIKILGDFLASPELYRTPYFQESHEQRARRNLAYEIEWLQQGRSALISDL